MAANTSAIFALTPNFAQARISAANTARDGSGSLTTLFTAGANGSRVDWIKWTGAQASAAASSSMVIRMFVTDNAGANPRLLQEVVMTGVTASNTVIGPSIVIDFLNGTIISNGTQSFGFINGGLILQSGQLIKVAQSVYAGVQDQNDVLCKGGDF